MIDSAASNFSILSLDPRFLRAFKAQILQLTNAYNILIQGQKWAKYIFWGSLDASFAGKFFFAGARIKMRSKDMASGENEARHASVK